MLSAILLPIKSTVASAVFWITLFEEVLNASAADYVAWSRRFWLYLSFTYLLIILQISLPILLAKDENP